MREAPSRVLIERLLEAGATVRAYDPEAGAEAARVFGARDGAAARRRPRPRRSKGADALAIVTEWKAFWSPDFERIRSALRGAVIFDGRNIYDPATVEAAGIAYYGVGRGRSVARPAIA